MRFRGCPRSSNIEMATSRKKRWPKESLSKIKRHMWLQFPFAKKSSWEDIIFHNSTGQSKFLRTVIEYMHRNYNKIYGMVNWCIEWVGIYKGIWSDSDCFVTSQILKWRSHSWCFHVFFQHLSTIDLRWLPPMAYSCLFPRRGGLTTTIIIAYYNYVAILHSTLILIYWYIIYIYTYREYQVTSVGYKL